MAVTYVGAGTVLDNTGAAATVAWPTHQTNDIGILVVETTGGAADMTAPTGWVEWCDLRDVSTTAGSRLFVFARRATSAAETAPNTTVVTDHKLARIHVFRGVDTAVDLSTVTRATGGQGSNYGNAASATATLPSITTTTANTCLVWIISRPDDSASTTHFGVPAVGTGATNGAPTGMAEAQETGTITGNGGGFVVSYGFKATAGATGTVTVSKTSSTVDNWITIGLPEAVSATAPGAPTGVTGTAGNGQVSLTWTAPVSNGGSAITDYIVQHSTSPFTSWTTFADGTSTATSATVTGLTNGTAYQFRVAAVNAIGTGSYSTNSSSVTPVSATVSILETYEVAPDGTAATSGNTSATSGFDPSVVLTVSTDWRTLGTRSLHVFGSEFASLRWDFGAITNLSISKYFRPVSADATAVILEIKDAADAIAAQLRLTNALALNIRDQTTSEATTASLNSGQPYRVEWNLDGNAGQTLRYYTGANLHSADPNKAVATITGALTPTSFTSVLQGILLTITPSVVSYYVDYFQISSTGMPSPAPLKAKLPYWGIRAKNT